MLTLRWYLLALLLPIGLLIAEWIPVVQTVALVYGAALLVITWLDRRGAGTARQLVIERTHDQKLSLGVPNPIHVILQNRSSRKLKGIIRDDLPLDFHTDDHLDPLTWECPPRDSTTLTYHVRPLHRGKFALGAVHVRWESPLGLVMRQAAYPLGREVRVYPNLYEIRKYELLVRRDQLAGMGVRTVKARGEGTSFASLRDYTPDDQYRSINWKATARRAKPISTDYEPERSQRIMIMIDVGRMMRSPIRVDDAGGLSWSMAKVDFVINSVLLLSYVARRTGDQVGLMVFADRVQQFIAPSPGGDHFQKLLEAMYALESQPVESDYGRAITMLRAQQKKRALVVLFTDLSGKRASDLLLRYMPSLLPHHLPLLVTIRDPALDQVVADRGEDSDAVYQRAVAEQMINERRLLLDSLERRGVLTVDIDAEQMSMAVVNRYLQLKRRDIG